MHKTTMKDSVTVQNGLCVPLFLAGIFGLDELNMLGIC